MTRREQNCPLAGLAPQFENSSLEFSRGVVVVIVGLSVAIRELPEILSGDQPSKTKGPHLCGPFGGAAGNRTRVLRHSLEASPCAVRYVSTRIS